MARALLALALCVLPSVSRAEATFFAALDRIEIDGNRFGPADGTADFVDEFDDGALGPPWVPILGSSIETAGVLAFHSPGTHMPFTPSVDASDVELTDTVVNGAGNYTVTSYWTSGLPGTDQLFHLQLFGQNPEVEAAGIQVSNLSPEKAAQFSPPALPGLAVSQILSYRDDGYSDLEILSYDAVPIDAASVTGRIVLRLAFDDATDLLTTSFSLDGGATFQSPFPALPAFTRVSAYYVLPGAAAIAQPGILPTQFLELKRFETRAASKTRTVIYQVRRFNVPIFVKPTAGGATLNVKVDGTAQCFDLPASGWTEVSPIGKFRYKDRTGAHGPVRSALLSTFAHTFTFNVKIAGTAATLALAPPNPGVEVDGTLSLAGLATYCSSSAGGSIRTNTERDFRVESAPAPATCAVEACQP
jgi:hypothetical protein